MLLAIFDGGFFCLRAVGSRQVSWDLGLCQFRVLVFRGKKTAPQILAVSWRICVRALSIFGEVFGHYCFW
jgi:hypothetical protein